jgi:hypothetical protein
MTVVRALTWLGQSAARAALTAAIVRLPGFRASAAAGRLRLPTAFIAACPPEAEFHVPAQADPAKIVNWVTGWRPAAATAGRAPASRFARVGSYVPQRLNR